MPFKGSRTEYDRHHSAIRRLRDTKTELLVECWCTAGYVLVPPEQVRAGITKPCKLAECKRMARAHA